MIDFSFWGYFLELSTRTKETGERYAVVKVEYHHKHRKLRASLMCFIPSIFEALQTERLYGWKGIVTFGGGNTFLSVTEVKNHEGTRIYTEPDTSEREDNKRAM